MNSAVRNRFLPPQRLLQFLCLRDVDPPPHPRSHLFDNSNKGLWLLFIRLWTLPFPRSLSNDCTTGRRRTETTVMVPTADACCFINQIAVINGNGNWNGEKETKRILYRISAILVPPLPMIHPMSSLGTAISWVVWGAPVGAPPCCCPPDLSWLPANAAKAVEQRSKWERKKNSSIIGQWQGEGNRAHCQLQLPESAIKRERMQSYVQWYIPEGLTPLPLVPVSPPRPKAARLASGFPANLVTCWTWRKGKKKTEKEEKKTKK